MTRWEARLTLERGGKRGKNGKKRGGRKRGNR